MANFQHPYQCLRSTRSSGNIPELLVTSAGPHLYVYNAANGERLDTWPPTSPDSTNEPASETAEASSEQGPPGKRRKLSGDGNPDAQAGQVNPQSQKKLVDSNAHGKLPWSEIPIVTTTSDGKYVVATTLEDKTIRVFQLSQEGKLQELNPRVMPKRLSAVAFTPDQQIILCADKHGDAYSLPLIPGDYIKSRIDETRKSLAATELTVHSKKNLRSLEHQKLMKIQKKQGAALSNEEKNVLNFEHQNILGHVSVLTDLLSVSVGGCNYILTADRDEHIRVSRGYPQAHVIEQFCLGHTSFISKICAPEWAPELLVSGGGDGELLLWDWRQGNVLQRIALQEILETEVTVRAIWDISIGGLDLILVGLEGSPKLLCYTIADNQLKGEKTIAQLSGNLLEVAVVKSQDSLIISVDTVREMGSTNKWKTSADSPQRLCEAFKVVRSDDGLQFVPAAEPIISNLNSAGTSPLAQNLNEKQKKSIDDSLYKMINMKKQKATEE